MGYARAPATDVVLETPARPAAVYPGPVRSGPVRHGVLSPGSRDVRRFRGRRVPGRGKQASRTRGAGGGVTADAAGRGPRGRGLSTGRAGRGPRRVSTGFRSRDLRGLSYATAAADRAEARRRRRRAGAVTRKLRLLRAHGPIRQVPESHRHLVTDQGRVATTALSAARAADTAKPAAAA